jgi:hypothetical protein
MAETNASGYGLEEIEIGEPAFHPGRCEAAFKFTAVGEQREGRVFVGDTIRGAGRAIIEADGSVRFDSLTAEVEYDEGYDDVEPEGGFPSP